MADTFQPLSEEDFADVKDVLQAGPFNDPLKVTPKARPPGPTGEEIEPSSIKRGAKAGFNALIEPVIRGKEKFEIAFPGRGEQAEQETMERIGKARQERSDLRDRLESTTAGHVGGFIGRSAPYALAGPTPMGQAAMAGMLGFLGGGSDQPTGIGQELMSSGLQGVTDAAFGGATTKGMQAVAQGVRGNMGQLTPQGQQAMGLNAATQRLGLPSPTIGQLDQTAPQALRAPASLVQQQAQALEQRMAQQRQAPTPGGGTETQTLQGGRLLEGMKEAVNVRKQQARSMYEAVDDYVTKHELGNVPSNYTVNTLSSINKKLTEHGKDPTGNNLVFNLLDNYDPDAFRWLKDAGSPKAAREAGMSMTQYHDARVAVGRSLGSLERIPPANRTADQNEAFKSLTELKSALDNDVERWAKQNAGNEEAMKLYNTAKEFYHKTAGPAINNPFTRKVVSQTRGFQSPEAMMQATMHPLNRSLVGRLSDTASPETRDLLNVLQNLPNVGRTVVSGSVPEAVAPSTGLGALVTSAGGHPGLAAMRTMPGLQALSRTRLAKNAYFGKGLPGYAVGPAGQYATEAPRGKVQDALTGRTR